MSIALEPKYYTLGIHGQATRLMVRKGVTGLEATREKQCVKVATRSGSWRELGVKGEGPGAAVDGVKGD